MLLVTGKSHIDRTAEGGDVHRLAHCILDVMAAGVLIVLLGDADAAQHLAFPDVHLARSKIELGIGKEADTVKTGDFQHCIVSLQRGCTIGTGHPVADIAADGPDVSYLRPADLVDCLPEDGNMLLDDRMHRNIGEAGKRADENRAIVLKADSSQFIKAVDVDQIATGKLSFANLDQDVTASGKPQRLGMLLFQAQGFFHCCRFVEVVEVIHTLFPYLIRAASVKASNIRCGCNGMALMATPVALSTALRMAGATGIVGGSPRDLFPYGPVGSLV
ncbi:hypothetical protein DSECCO2_601710 [anaerobic digester metagenome]